MPLTEKQKAEIIKQVKRIVVEKHVNVANPSHDYESWGASVDSRTPDLVHADDESFESGMRQLLVSLGSSHTGFYRRHGDVPAPHSIHATLSAIQDNGRDVWMFLDIVEDGAAFQAGIRSGHLLFGVDGAALAPPKAPTFRLGAKHRLRIGQIGSKNAKEVEVDVPNRMAKDRPPMVEPRSITHRILENGIGYMKIASFPGTVGLQFAAALGHALAELKAHNCDRLIVDLRGNVGGGLGSLRLMSYLCAGKLPIGYSLTRRKLRAGCHHDTLPRIGKIPASKFEQIRMAIRFKVFQRDRSLALFTEGLGEQSWHSRTVVLINEHTASAAEMVASFVKENRLATLVGTNTSGQVLGGANFRLPEGYMLRIPVAGWYSWTGTCIEGCGVKPDIAVSVDKESIAEGRDAQLEMACVYLLSEAAAFAVG
jgi:C-terminal processing protease CtpA/Prc